MVAMVPHFGYLAARRGEHMAMCRRTTQTLGNPCMKTLNIAACLALCVLVTACNKQDADGKPAQTASAPVTAAKPTFASCFTLKPNVSYTMTHDSHVSITKATVGDKPAMAVTDESEGIRTVNYYDIDGHDGLVAEVEYGSSALGTDPAKPMLTTTYSQPRQFPADAAPGASFQVEIPAATLVNSATNETKDVPKTTQAFTFVGFEDVEIDGSNDKIANACHLQSKDGDQVRDLWYAADLGLIEMSLHQGDMNILSESIVSRPESHD